VNLVTPSRFKSLNFQLEQLHQTLITLFLKCGVQPSKNLVFLDLYVVVALSAVCVFDKSKELFIDSDEESVWTSVASRSKW
jgi:hypothetical protein